MNTRICRSCGETKPATAEFFQRFGSHTSRLRHTCRECRLARGKNEKYQRRYAHLPGGKEAIKLKKDGAQCQICGSSSNLCIDHSHNKQYVRGIICNNCNLGLGHFKDYSAVLESAIEYVIASDSYHRKGYIE